MRSRSHNKIHNQERELSDPDRRNELDDQFYVIFESYIDWWIRDATKDDKSKENIKWSDWSSIQQGKQPLTTKIVLLFKNFLLDFYPTKA